MLAPEPRAEADQINFQLNSQSSYLTVCHPIGQKRMERECELARCRSRKYKPMRKTLKSPPTGLLGPYASPIGAQRGMRSGRLVAKNQGCSSPIFQ